MAFDLCPYRRRVLALALILGICTRPASAGPIRSGVVSLADGPPYVLIRGYKVMSAGTGAAIAPGDIIQTGAGNVLVIEFNDGAIVGIGPSTRTYLMAHATIPTLVLLQGWVKVDTLAPAKSALHRVLGTRLGAESANGTFVMRAAETADEIFDESGTMRVLPREAASTDAPRDSKAGQFFVARSEGAVATELKPDRTFIADLPIPFRDRLPSSLASRLNGTTTAPKLLRPASYDDVSAWLAMPRDLRVGFVERFKPRLRDPAFFSAVEAHLNRYPEWDRVLHPVPASESQ